MLATSANATPYASCLTNNSGVISFRLNEAAESVQVIQGATTVTLGPKAAGLTVTNLSTSLTAGTFRVVVTKSSTCGISLLGGTTAFNAPKGVAVNRNPASPFFGRIYVANATAATRGDGIFLFNPDLSDAVGQTNTARTAGLDFGTGTTASPYRLTVGPEDQLYICDWSNPKGNLYVTDPNVLTGGFALASLTNNAFGTNTDAGMDVTPKLPVGTNNNHGSVAAVAVQGKLADGSLVIYTVDEDLQPDRMSETANLMNSVWKYPVGSGPLPFSGFDTNWLLFTPAINWVSQTMDLAIGPNGYLYVSQYRSSGSEVAVSIIDPTLTPGFLTNSKMLSDLAGSGADLFKACGGVAVSPSGRWIATINIENNQLAVAPMTAGIPDLSKVIYFTGLGTGAGRGVAFDAADNLLVVTDAAGLRQVSLGLPSVATTTSDGTFTVSFPGSAQTLSVAPTLYMEQGMETGPVPASFTITRSGDTSGSLTVNYTLSGSASNGVDYVTVPTSATFSPGQTEITVTITPIDDLISEPNETVVLTLACSASYESLKNTATVTILDNEPPLVGITLSAASMYEGLTNDYVSFRINRTGDMFNPPTEVKVVWSGTAQNGVDYTFATNTVVINGDYAGTNSALVLLRPIDDTLLEGNETITATLQTGTGYVLDTNTTANATLVDDEVPAETVLFSDNFDTDTTGNWTVKFGTNPGGAQDYTNKFNLDYGAMNIPPPAKTTTTRGLLASVNKLDATALAAGVNLYANGQNFSGNYALRFQMYVEGVNGSGTTEHVIFGINHSGANTNWFRSTGLPAGWLLDGIWCQVVADASALGDYVMNSAPLAGATPAPTVRAARLASTLTTSFKAPPYRFAGSPGAYGPTGLRTWADVELRQLNSLISLYINKVLIFSYTNTTSATNGTIMLGYNDAYNSIGGGTGNSALALGGYVVFDNVRVVRIGNPVITGIRLQGGNAVITFTSANGDSAAQFALQAAAQAPGAYTDTTATITETSPGSYSTQVPVSGDAQFYRIRVKN